MKEPTKEIKLNPRKTINGKYYTKLNNCYIGYLTETELNLINKELPLLSERMKPNEIINYFRSVFVDKQKGLKISKGMKQAKYKQYNKKLDIKTIKKIKAMANYYNITENQLLTNLINEKYNFFVGSNETN